MKSEKSVAEFQMEELLKECEDIIDDSYLKTQDARKIMDAAGKILMKCKELRISRDKSTIRRDLAEKELKKQEKQ